jgi:hypothetical protein
MAANHTTAESAVRSLPNPPVLVCPGWVGRQVKIAELTGQQQGGSKLDRNRIHRRDYTAQPSQKKTPPDPCPCQKRIPRDARRVLARNQSLGLRPQLAHAPRTGAVIKGSLNRGGRDRRAHGAFDRRGAGAEEGEGEARVPRCAGRRRRRREREAAMADARAGLWMGLAAFAACGPRART